MSDYISQTITVSSCLSDISNQCRIKTPCITGMAEKSNPPLPVLGGGGGQGDKITSGYITFAFSRCPKEGGVATSPLLSQVAQKRVESLHDPSCLCVCGGGGGTRGSAYITFAFSRCPKKGRVATLPLPSGGSPTREVK